MIKEMSNKEAKGIQERQMKCQKAIIECQQNKRLYDELINHYSLSKITGIVITGADMKIYRNTNKEWVKNAKKNIQENILYIIKSHGFSPTDFCLKVSK